jgi:hypothetical protein
VNAAPVHGATNGCSKEEPLANAFGCEPTGK